MAIEHPIIILVLIIIDKFVSFSFSASPRARRYLSGQPLEFLDNVSAISAEPDRKIPLTFGPKGLPFRETVEAFEKQVLLEALTQNSWHQSHTAAMLAIPEKTLYNKIKKYQLKKPETKA